MWKIVNVLAGLESGKFPINTFLDTKPCITYEANVLEHNDLGFGVMVMKML